MKHTVICGYCGKPFETTSGVAKYCSANCRWLAYSKRNKKKAEEEAAAESRREEEERKHQDDARAKKERKKLEASAVAGDSYARMKLTNQSQVEYWRAFSDYVQKWPGNFEVNGISVNDPEFSEKVLITIEELGIIRTHLIRE